jgi:MFS family permease
VLAYLDVDIAGATWLIASEKRVLAEAIARDVGQKQADSITKTLLDPRVWLTGAIYFCFVAGLYGVGFWLPTIISGMGVKSPLNVGILTAIPYAAGAVGMVLVGKSADYHRERRWHVAIPAGLGAIGLILGVSLSSHTVPTIIALSLAAFGILTTLPLFWSLPTAFLAGTAAAAGLAFINSIGNLAGFISPFAVGWIKDLTQSTDNDMYLIASLILLGGFLVIAFVPARLVNHCHMHQVARRFLVTELHIQRPNVPEEGEHDLPPTSCPVRRLAVFISHHPPEIPGCIPPQIRRANRQCALNFTVREIVVESVAALTP